MCENELKLYFDGQTEPVLFETHFRRATDNSLQICVRGKTLTIPSAAGTFQWTTAVRALSVLFVRIALSNQNQSLQSMNCLSGHKSSLAASLDYALSKQPQWLQEMFGLGSFGTVYARRLILRTNSERKRPGPVTLGVNTVVLKPERIQIYLDSKLVTSSDTLADLLARLESRQKGMVTEHSQTTVCDLAA
jgi:hypothetical protein